MYVRDEIRELWAEGGVLDSKNVRVQEFVKYVDTHPLECWDEYIAIFRRDYYDLFDQLIPPLLKSRDRAVRLVLITKSDIAKPKELAVLKEVIRRVDPVADKAELVALVRRGDQVLIDTIKRQRKWSSELEELVAPQPIATRPATNTRTARRRTGSRGRPR